MQTYENIPLDRSMYAAASKSFPGFWRRWTYRPLPGHRAWLPRRYQRQLKRFDIRVKGAGSDVVEKFFRTADSAVLFPEYIARSVRQGMEESDILPQHHRRCDPF